MQLEDYGRFGDTEIRNIDGVPNHVNETEAHWIDNYGLLGQTAAKAYGIMSKHLMDVEKQYVKQLDKMAQFPGLIGDYLNKLKGKKTLKDTEIDKFLSILKGDELGLMSHNFFVDMFEPMLKNRMLVDGAFKGRKTNFSSYLHIRPNFAQDVQEHEGKISPSERVSWNKFIKLYLE